MKGNQKAGAGGSIGNDLGIGSDSPTFTVHTSLHQRWHWRQLYLSWYGLP